MACAWLAPLALAEDVPINGEPYQAERQQYRAAVQAIRKGRLDDYRALRAGLDDYPLAIYLDYYDLTARLSRVRPAEASAFLAASQGTPLPNRFLSLYLRRLGERSRWRDFLVVLPREPNSVELKCYHFRAQLAVGNRATAYAGAEKLWLLGRSQPKACDPLFATWIANGELDDDLVWQRMLLAFGERQSSLLRYVARKGGPGLKPWSDQLQRVYRDPSQLSTRGLDWQDARTRQLVIAGLSHLARYQPGRALERWQQFNGALSFTPEEIMKVESAIALQGMFARSDALRDWLPGALDRLDDDKLVGIRLRWALAEQDWRGVRETLPLLSAEAAGQGSWRYWRAVALADAGRVDEARVILRELAGERGFHSFLAADYLQQPYAFNAVATPAQDISALVRLPAVQRIGELKYHGENNSAHSEWATLLANATTPQEQLQLGYLAAASGWHRKGIDAAAKARAWDALDLRFPTPWRDVFTAYGNDRQVPATELMAIARRESAFYPEARSSAGARGLMQVMPATAMQVASSIGKRYAISDLYDVEYNVTLGSAYYRQMLDLYDNNRIFTLAAYNAGPHRVDRWRNESAEALPADLWVETIPFKETRDYVQAVLAYNVVFAHLIGDTASLLTVKERKTRY